jgi:hypothetical protein
MTEVYQKPVTVSRMAGQRAPPGGIDQTLRLFRNPGLSVQAIQNADH